MTPGCSDPSHAAARNALAGQHAKQRTGVLERLALLTGQLPTPMAGRACDARA